MTKIVSLVGTGVLLGIVHVLTGPDHLSALATLSANVDTRLAFFLGVRWGIGHSTGLLLVGVTFIVISRTSESETIDIPEGVSRFFESLVGIFMLLLGVYGIRRATNKQYSGILDLHVVGEGSDDASDEVDVESVTHSCHNHVNVEHGHVTTADDTIGSEDPFYVGKWLVTLASTVSTRTMALFAGIVHGLAGPGGVLGVIPAVQLHNWRLAAIYLSCFCTSSTLTMGIFAVLYGSCSSKIGQDGRRGFIVEILSASLSILVGFTWLFLLAIGKLDDVFP